MMVILSIKYRILYQVISMVQDNKIHPLQCCCLPTDFVDGDLYNTIIFKCFLVRADISFLKLKHTGHSQHKIQFTQLSNVIVEWNKYSRCSAATLRQ
jgi:hypothetical protein